jgi:hypothetical protein
MGRQIITKNDVARIQGELQELAKLRQQLGAVAGTAPAPDATITEDKYKDKLLKYIPADVIAIYLTLHGFVPTLPPAAPRKTLYWIIFLLILALSVPWQRKVAKIGNWTQVWIGTGAFVVWAISVGDPFTTDNFSWYYPAYGSMILALYTFLIPLFEIK